MPVIHIHKLYSGVVAFIWLKNVSGWVHSTDLYTDIEVLEAFTETTKPNEEQQNHMLKSNFELIFYKVYFLLTVCMLEVGMQ